MKKLVLTNQLNIMQKTPSNSAPRKLVQSYRAPWLRLLPIAAMLFSSKTVVAYNFDTFYADAIKNSPNLKAAEQRYEVAKLSRDLIGYGDAASVLLQSTLGGNRDETPGPNQGFNKDQRHAIQLTLPLYDFGRQSDLDGAATKRLEESAHDKTLAEVGIQALAGRIFVNAIHGKSVYEKAKAQFEIAAAKLRKQKDNFAQGLRPEADLIAAEIDFSKAEATFARADHDYQIYLNDLKFFAGKAGSSVPLQVSYDSLMISELKNLFTKSPPDDLNNHPKISKIQAELAALDFDRQHDSDTRWPMLNGALRFGENGSLSPLYPRLEASLQLTWDIPVNQKMTKTLLQNRARYSEAEINLSGIRDELQQSYKQGLQKLNNYSNEHELLSKQLELASRQVLVTERRYQNGSATALELSVVENQLVTFELQELDLVYRARLQAVDLYEISGKPEVRRIFNRQGSSK